MLTEELNFWKRPKAHLDNMRQILLLKSVLLLNRHITFITHYLLSKMKIKIAPAHVNFFRTFCVSFCALARSNRLVYSFVEVLVILSRNSWLSSSHTIYPVVSVMKSKSWIYCFLLFQWRLVTTITECLNRRWMVGYRIQSWVGD